MCANKMAYIGGMDFVFDIRKTVAASAFLCDLNEGHVSVLYLMKMLYLADREALLNWRRPITGDRFFSLEQGPILSHTYNLCKGIVAGPEGKQWDAVFTKTGKWINHNGQAGKSWLSGREEAALKAAFKKITAMPTKKKMVEHLHKILPEWEDPGKSSRPIEAETIFIKEGFEREEIEEAMDEIREVHAAKKAFAV